jgi:hypothetical protein
VADFATPEHDYKRCCLSAAVVPSATVIAAAIPVAVVPVATLAAPALIITMRPDRTRRPVHRRWPPINRRTVCRRTEGQPDVQVRVSLGNSDHADRKTGGNEQMGDDALHGVSPVWRRVSHESNLRNGRLTSIDELLLVESNMQGS